MGGDRLPRLRSGAEALSTTPRGERRDAVANRERILATARELFAARGVEAVAMRDVALAAGIGQGTLYRHFSHKGALCHALLDENLQQFHDGLVGRLEAEMDRLPVLAQLQLYLDGQLTFIEANGPLASAMGDSACGVTPEEHYQNPWAVWQRETLARLLERAVVRGELGPVDVEATVDLILAGCEPSTYLYLRHGRGYSRERIVANLLRLLAGPERSTRGTDR